MNSPRDSVEIEQPQSPSSPPPVNPGVTVPTNGVNTNISTETNGAPPPPPHQTPVKTAAEAAVEAETYKNAGNKFFKARDFDKAIKEYTKAIEADPQASTYFSNRSAAYMSANRYHEALEDCKSADERDPNNAKILHRLGRIYTSLGRPQEALQALAHVQPPVTAKDKAPAEAMAMHIKQAEDALREGTTGSMALHALDQAERGLGLGVDRPRKWKLMRGEAYLKMGNVNSIGDAEGVAMSLLRLNNQDP